MKVNLQLQNHANGKATTVKEATLKVADRSTRTSLVMLAKKWAALSGVASHTNIVDINTYVVEIPSAGQAILIERDALDEIYADKMVMEENSKYVWYVPEFSYGTKVMKGVWR